MPYRELTESYEVVYGAESSSAVRMFVDDANGSTAILPAIGDRLGTTDADRLIFVQTIRKVPFGKLPNTFQYTVNYATKMGDQSSDSGSAVTPPDAQAGWSVSGNVGGEVISIDGDNKSLTYHWLTAEGDTVAQKVNLLSYTLPFALKRRKIKSFSKFTLMNYSGRVNTATFAGCPAGYVLFEGAAFQDYYNEKGSVEYEVTLNFIIKVVVLANNSTGGWQYLYREDAGAFQLVVPNLYKTADLNKLTALKSGVFT